MLVVLRQERASQSRALDANPLDLTSSKTRRGSIIPRGFPYRAEVAMQICSSPRCPRTFIGAAESVNNDRLIS